MITELACYLAALGFAIIAALNIKNNIKWGIFMCAAALWLIAGKGR